MWVRPIDGGAELQVDGKEESIRVRQLLVRLGVHCTFPLPLWRRSRYSFFATYPRGVTHAEFEGIVSVLSGVQLGGSRS